MTAGGNWTENTTMGNDDSVLMTAASQGDQVAIESLYVRHMPAFRAYVRLSMGRLLKAKETESDVVQSVFRDVLENLENFEWKGEAAFRHWLYEKGRRKIIDHGRHYRAQKRDAAKEKVKSTTMPSVEECYQALGTPSQMAMGRESIDRLEKAFEELPEDYAEVIVNARILGLNSGEIAERMNRKEGTVRVLLCRALARLSTLLAQTVD